MLLRSLFLAALTAGILGASPSVPADPLTADDLDCRACVQLEELDKDSVDSDHIVAGAVTFAKLAEATLACAILNKMAQLGMPDGYWVTWQCLPAVKEPPRRDIEAGSFPE